MVRKKQKTHARSTTGSSSAAVAERAPNEKYMAELKAECLKESPKIFYIENFLSSQECDHFIQCAKDKLQLSLGYDVTTGKDEKVDIRTSSQTWLFLNEDAIITKIEKQISQLTNIPQENGEQFSIIRYQIGQEYQAHWDYFDPAFAGSATALARGGQRIVTVILYLNDVEEGGETEFTTLNLTVKPKKGALLYFSNVLEDGSIDTNTLHAGVPVKVGEKWIATKWLRERPFSAHTQQKTNQEITTSAATSPLTAKTVETAPAKESHRASHNVYLPATPVRLLSHFPPIIQIDNFISAKECRHLIQCAKDNLEKSLGYDVSTGKYTEVDIRTSSQTWLKFRQDEIITAIEERIASFSNIPPDYGEPFSIIRYQIGQEYQAHYDYFDPAYAGNAGALARGGQRQTTAILYLCDVDEGGETEFPELNLKIAPTRGSLLYFSNVKSDGTIDANTLHAGVPVEVGEKWIATKWLREKPFK